MWNWLRLLFGFPLVTPTIVNPVVEVVDVRKALVRLLLKDGKTYEFTLFGSIGLSGTGWEYVIDASDRFDAWQERVAKTGMIAFEGNVYKPMSVIDKVTVEYSEHLMERK